jgi:hypothetical protein
MGLKMCFLSILVWLANLFEALVILKTQGIELRNYVNSRKVKESYKKIRKYIKYFPVKKFNLESKFIFPNEIREIVEDNEKSVILSSTSKMDALLNIATMFYENFLFYNKCIQKISLELWLATSYVMTKQRVIPEEIKNCVDITLLKSYVVKKCKYDRDKLEEYIEKLMYIASCGFFNSIFVQIVVVNKFTENEEEVANLINELERWGDEYKNGEQLNKKEIEVGHKSFVFNFVGSKTNNMSLIDQCLKNIKEKQKVLALASFSFTPTCNNFEIMSKLIPKLEGYYNFILTDEYLIKEKEWIPNYISWITKGKRVIKKEFDTLSYSRSIDIYKKNRFKIILDPENIKLLNDKILKSGSFQIRELFIAIVKGRNFIFIEKINIK